MGLFELLKKTAKETAPPGTSLLDAIRIAFTIYADTFFESMQPYFEKGYEFIELPEERHTFPLPFGPSMHKAFFAILFDAQSKRSKLCIIRANDDDSFYDFFVFDELKASDGKYILSLIREDIIDAFGHFIDAVREDLKSKQEWTGEI